MIEYKANILENFFDKALKVFNISQVTSKINKWVLKHYDQGLEEKETELNVNFTRNNQRVDLLQAKVAEDIKGVSEDIKKNIRREVQESMLNNESIPQLRKRISSYFKNTEPLKRINAIAITEKNRAENFGGLDAAKQLPIKMRKYLDITYDDRTSPVSKAMGKKYGSNNGKQNPKLQSIPIDQEFKVTVKIGKKTKTFAGLVPPFHVHDRDRTQYISQREYNELKNKEDDK